MNVEADVKTPDSVAMFRVEAFVTSLSGVSPHTRRAYEFDSTEFATWCCRGVAPEPNAVNARVLRRYLAFLDTKGLSRSTIARKAASVRALLRYLQRHDAIDVNPGSQMTTPRVAKRLPRVVRSDEANALLDRVVSLTEHELGAAHDADRDHAHGEPDTVSLGTDRSRALIARDLAILELLYGAGLRVGELCGLAETDIDLRRGLVTVLGKGSKVRRVPIGEPACIAAARYSELRCAKAAAPAQDH